MATPEKKPPRNKYAFACAVLASMTSILLGYDIGVMSGAGIYIQKDLRINNVQLEVLNGIISLYAMIGAAAAGRTSDWIGRRFTMVLAGSIFLVGALVMGFGFNYGFLMFGRFIAGIGVGYAMMIAPVYTAEVSPASSRGFLTSFPEVFINCGVLLGYVSNYGFSKLPLRLGWRFMLGIGAVPSILLALGVLTMPESPRWLVMQGRLGDAKRVLQKTSDTPQEAELRLSDIKEAAGIPLECNDEKVQVTREKSHGEGVWHELLIRPTPAVRHVMIAAVGIHFFQQASGIDSVVLYSPTIFGAAGIKSSDHKLLATIAVGFFKASFILVATFLLDRIGRRPLVLTSEAGMMLSLTALGTGLTVVDNSAPNHSPMWAVVLCISSVMTFVASFSIGMGPSLGLQLGNIPSTASSTGGEHRRMRESSHQRAHLDDFPLPIERHNNRGDILPVRVGGGRLVGVLLHDAARDPGKDPRGDGVPVREVCQVAVCREGARNEA